ncbi:MAG: 4-hydroxybenzoate octaprenyltransferase [Rhodospirillales bacterium]
MSDRVGKSASDIRSGNWVDQYVPAAARPYLRLARVDRPIGIWLLMFPCWWGVALASPAWPDPWLLLLFGIGALLMRGAGCTFNDIADRDFDARVARTANRPLPSGAISLNSAVLFMIGLSLAAFIVLLQFNAFSVGVGIASLLVVAIYPFAKRVTHWPQAVLGLAFNWGALLGWTAVSGSLAVSAFLLYAGGILWTLGYDTIYAHQDKEDDVLIGVKSTALRLGTQSRRFVALFYACAWALIVAAALSAGMPILVIVLLLPVAAQLAWQVVTIDFDNPGDCLSKFKSNRWMGLSVFAALVGARVLG